MTYEDQFGAKKTLATSAGDVTYFDINVLEQAGMGDISKLPFSIKILLESLLRNVNGYDVMPEDVAKLAKWSPEPGDISVPFKLARVILQDFTGVPAVVDLAAMRSAMARMGADPGKINPLVQSDLVIDHSVQVDQFGSPQAFRFNVDREYERNGERYALLKWAQRNLSNFRVVPPGMGIVHQINLEHIAKVVGTRELSGETFAFPDSVVGTDSHTTMINGLGVLGWGVGGIEAEAVMLGQPYYMLAPKVVGVRLYGQLPQTATATDLVLTVTEMLRAHGVVDRFVEFYGSGLSGLPVTDRATIANMAPEYGATMGFFPVDEVTLDYLKLTGRDSGLIELVEKYARAVGLFRTDSTVDPVFSETLELDLSTIQSSVAGPKRPQDRVLLNQVKDSFGEHLVKPIAQNGFALDSSVTTKSVAVADPEGGYEITHGSVVLAAITSCTNTSNPDVMLGAGLLAKNAVESGLQVAPWVKPSLAPGSRVVTEYLEHAGLTPYLESLKFHLVGYGCTTCIGNSGPLPAHISSAIEEGDLVVASVLSGNRNFEGRINPLTRANYLASPMLVVAYALAGRVDFDFEREPLGTNSDGKDVYLSDIWPSKQEIADVVGSSVTPDLFSTQYASVFEGEDRWKDLAITESELFDWDLNSTYVREPNYFDEIGQDIDRVKDITGARILAVLGDSVTTDHISPAGAISGSSPAAKYLTDNETAVADFNSYGARRGNHEVMVRGTFGNIRLKNRMLDGIEGGVTKHLPSNEQMSIFEAAERYKNSEVPVIILAGKEYGAGSSRDWAAKGPMLLGVRAVIAESYERIHRSNLIGMGILPLQFTQGDSVEALGLTGTEVFSITGISGGLNPGKQVDVSCVNDSGDRVAFSATVRINTQVEVDYYANGGILQTVLSKMLAE
jgi:aconitate hydratase